MPELAPSIKLPATFLSPSLCCQPPLSLWRPNGGKPLFSRSNRGIELTPFGKVFLSYITPIHMQLCQLDDMIFKEQKKPQHHLTIASNGFHFISNICSELYKKYQSEGIKLESREAFGIEALNLVSNQIAEIGIIRQWSCYKNLYSSQCRCLESGILSHYPVKYCRHCRYRESSFLPKRKLHLPGHAEALSHGHV